MVVVGVLLYHVMILNFFFSNKLLATFRIPVVDSPTQYHVCLSVILMHVAEKKNNMHAKSLCIYNIASHRKLQRRHVECFIQEHNTRACMHASTHNIYVCVCVYNPSSSDSSRKSSYYNVSISYLPMKCLLSTEVHLTPALTPLLAIHCMFVFIHLSCLVHLFNSRSFLSVIPQSDLQSHPLLLPHLLSSLNNACMVP